MKVFILESDSIQLISLNAAFATLKNGRRVRSKAYSKFKTSIDALLRSRKDEFKAFEFHFNSKLHEIHAKLEMGVVGLYTKSGTISRNSGDISNFEKCLLDCVMTGKVDDSAIVHWEMRKFDSKKHFFRLTLEIKDR